MFSCSLLHEATPVIAGKRYAFLPFIYDEAAAAVRRENAHLLSDELLDLNPAAARTQALRSKILREGSVIPLHPSLLSAMW